MFHLQPCKLTISDPLSQLQDTFNVELVLCQHFIPRIVIEVSESNCCITAVKVAVINVLIGNSSSCDKRSHRKLILLYCM